MHTHPLSLRSQQIAPFIVMDVLERAQTLEQEGENIIHMEIGEPDFPTPPAVTEAAVKALQDNDTHYTSSLGKLSLREEIAASYWRKYKVEVSPDQILVTSGTSPALLLTLSALLDRGSEVILADPYYACYPNFIRYMQGTPVTVPVAEENGFKFDPKELPRYINQNTRAILVNSPSNPTGVVCSDSDLKALAATNQLIISDEIYNGLIYDGQEHTILEFTDNAFVLNGFSKLYAMTGWRLGYVIAPRDYMRAIQKVQQNLFICASSFVQEGGIAALKYCDQEVKEMVKTYDERRRYVLKRLKEMSIGTAVEPTGAFYALLNMKRYTSDSYSFAFELLQKIGVALTPGIDFGPNCEGYLRISYATSLPNLKEGLDRLENYLASLKQD
jgi:aspartate/methionine/tyrosine aminotransferase